MTALRIEWAAPAKKQFEELQQRAIAAGHVDELLATHNQIVDILGDLEQTIEKSDPLYNTKKPWGVVRHLRNQFLSVTIYLFPDERVGWVTKYRSIPASWPF